MAQYSGQKLIRPVNSGNRPSKPPPAGISVKRKQQRQQQNAGGDAKPSFDGSYPVFHGVFPVCWSGIQRNAARGGAA